MSIAHIHGVDPSCREHVIGGTLVGECWLTRASRTAQTAADVFRANALAASADDDHESASSWMQDANDLEQIAAMLTRPASSPPPPETP